jgi:hypothetical protein
MSGYCVIVIEDVRRLEVMKVIYFGKVKVMKKMKVMKNAVSVGLAFVYLFTMMSK